MAGRDPDLLSLPDGVICLILSFLDFQSKVCCEQVNRQLYGLLNHPGLWQQIHVTLEQLLESVDSHPIRAVSTPAARWILSRVGQGKSGGASHIHLQGDADCIVKGSRVACFFAALRERNAQYSMSAKLSGLPLEVDFESEYEQQLQELHSYAQRDVAALWNNHLCSLHLHTLDETYLDFSGARQQPWRGICLGPQQLDHPLFHRSFA
ncbi:hypothetical protein WJX73_010252 [Symbiochloris irregularis]|uniref:F-box domain-containing protein n=1 Tax=Symbiochloris irregularis TaxID=706552 RepID=A0AAW1PW86_9CHLO